MDRPKITIITPNYNQAEFIEETILSVIEQSYQNVEYIIIDGGSTDGSVEIIKKYEKYLAYWISEPDKGLYHALQKGFDRATGEIFGWINSDDKLHPHALSVIAEIFGCFEEVNWLTGCLSVYDEKGRTISAVPPKQWSKYHFYLHEYEWIQQESTFWRKSLWHEAGGYLNVDLKYAADFELWLRFFRYAKLFTIQTILGGFRLRSANQLSILHREKYIEEVEGLLAKEIRNLPPQEKKRLAFYKKTMTITSWIENLKIFNTPRIKLSFRNRLHNSTGSIEFDQTLKKFKLMD